MDYIVRHAFIRIGTERYPAGTVLSSRETDPEVINHLQVFNAIEPFNSIPPLPTFQPTYFTALNAPWGDALASIGWAQWCMKQIGQSTCKFILHTKHKGIKEFMLAQPWIEDVIEVLVDSESYAECCAKLHPLEASIQNIDKWLYMVNGIDKLTVWPTHIDRGAMSTAYCPPPSNLLLPDKYVAWAKNWKATHASEGFILLNPCSENSEAVGNHWNHWKKALDWLVKLPFTFVLVGLSNVHKIKAPNVIDLTARTDSNMNVLALLELSDGYIGTSNNVAIYNLSSGKKAIVCSNLSCRTATNFFNRLIDRAPNTWIRYSDGLDAFQNLVKALFQDVPIPLVTEPIRIFNPPKGNESVVGE